MDKELRHNIMNTYVLPRKGNGILNALGTFIQSFSENITMRLVIPTNVFNRTQLICEYIEGEVEINFGIEDFLMVVYMDYIKSSVRKYDPIKIYKELNSCYGYTDKIKISSGSYVQEYDRLNCRKTEITISMTKKDARKGQLLLNEMKELYGLNMSFDKMLIALWINFIEKYKRGDSSKCLKAILKILKDTIEKD